MSPAEINRFEHMLARSLNAASQIDTGAIPELLECEEDDLFRSTMHYPQRDQVFQPPKKADYQIDGTIMNTTEADLYLFNSQTTTFELRAKRVVVKLIQVTRYECIFSTHRSIRKVGIYRLINGRIS